MAIFLVTINMKRKSSNMFSKNDRIMLEISTYVIGLSVKKNESGEKLKEDESGNGEEDFIVLCRDDIL